MYSKKAWDAYRRALDAAPSGTTEHLQVLVAGPYAFESSEAPICDNAQPASAIGARDFMPISGLLATTPAAYMQAWTSAPGYTTRARNADAD